MDARSIAWLPRLRNNFKSEAKAFAAAETNRLGGGNARMKNEIESAKCQGGFHVD